MELFDDIENRVYKDPTVKEILYRGFIITDEKYQDIINDFYNTEFEYYGYIGNSFNSGANCQCLTVNKYKQIEELLHFQYNNHTMWDLVENGIITEEVITWKSSIRWLVLNILQYQLYTLDNITDGYIRKQFICNELIRHHILFDKIYKTKYMGYSRFHQTFMAKIIDFMMSGMIEGFLLFAHYYPHLVCRDIYPIFVKYSVTYNETDIELLCRSSVYGGLYQKYKYFIHRMIDNNKLTN